MKLNLKKNLAAKTLNVGKERIIFDSQRLEEIKEAITKQDIRDLVANKAILVKEPMGRRKNVKRKTRRRVGKIKKKVKNAKQEYVKITRKLRKFVKNLKDKERISSEDYKDLRKQIRNRKFRSQSQLKENLG